MGVITFRKSLLLGCCCQTQLLLESVVRPPRVIEGPCVPTNSPTKSRLGGNGHSTGARRGIGRHVPIFISDYVPNGEPLRIEWPFIKNSGDERNRKPLFQTYCNETPQIQRKYNLGKQK